MIAARGVSGTDTKCDCLVSVETDQSFFLECHGTNARLYSGRTEKIVRETLKKYGVETARVTIQDKGALALVIRARLETAVERFLEEMQS